MTNILSVAENRVFILDVLADRMSFLHFKPKTETAEAHYIFAHGNVCNGIIMTFEIIERGKIVINITNYKASKRDDHTWYREYNDTNSFRKVVSLFIGFMMSYVREVYNNCRKAYDMTLKQDDHELNTYGLQFSNTIVD